MANASIISKSSVLDLYGQPVYTANPPVNQARLFYDSGNDTIVCLDSNGNNLLGGSSGATGFNAITSGTNTTATLTVGSGAILTYSGTGVINASEIDGVVVTGTPSAGQTIVASNGTTAAWGTVSGSTAFNLITGGTNSSAAMIVGTGASLTVSGSGTINATSVGGITITGTPSVGYIPTATSGSAATWQAAPTGTPSFSAITAGTNTTALVIGTSGSLTVSGSGTINATSIGGITVTGTPSVGYVPVATSGSAATWQAAASPAFAALTSGTNSSAAMVVGTGALLTISGSGTINATSINSNSFPASAGFTSGGIPYFSSTSVVSSSGVLTATGLVIGGGAGSSPTVSANLTFVSPTLTIGVAGSVTGIVKLSSSTATGSVSLTPASAASAFTLTLPAITDTLVSLTATQILTNKTLSAGTISGTLKDGSASVGTSGQLLSSTGSAVQWVAAPTGGVAEYIQPTSGNLNPVIFNGALNTLVEATTGSGTITATLPTAVGIGGQIIRLIKVDSLAGTLAIATTSSQTINGVAASNFTITNQWQIISLESDNANWIIIATAN